VLAVGLATGFTKPPTVELNVLTTLRTTPRVKAGLLNAGAAFIVAHDAVTQRVFITNAVTNAIDIIDVSNVDALAVPEGAQVLSLSASSPALPTPFTRLDMGAYGSTPLSVATHNGILAVSMQAGATGNVQKTLPGKVVFFDANLQFIRAVEVGAYPDMLTFSPNGRFVLVANEGEPASYLPADLANGSDPEGSVAIIDLANGIDNLTVRTADFHAFNGRENELRVKGIRIFGPSANAARDLEPEYIAVSQDSKTAWVTLQDNNALAIVDIREAAITELVSLGEKNHNLPGNGLDPSALDGGIKIQRWPVFGMYQSDAIAAYRVRGDDYLVVANEGDSRQDWPGLKEEATVGAVSLDAASFSGWNTTDVVGENALKAPANLGALKITNIPSWFVDPTDGVVKKANQYTGSDGKPVYTKLYTFGARSFSIRDAAGRLVWDSGDAFERITGAAAPNGFNTSHDKNTLENRSPSKGPEPEGVAVGKAFGRTYAFIGLERIGGVMVYDITTPTSPEFVQYINQRDFTKNVLTDDAGDLGPEGMVFVSDENSPTGKPLLVVAHELSGTTTIFEIQKRK
jgi:DNA-binding beta-propeller fold protein YncE